MGRKLVGLTLASCLLVSVSAAHAQQSASSAIVGQVNDATQGGLPGATVTVMNVGTGAERITVTDGQGRFSMPGLPAATYKVKVELSGFQTTEIAELVLRNGETAQPRVTLSIGTIAEQVTVVGESPMLQTASGSVGQVISEKMIEELPINGRGVLSLASLSAAVTPRAFNRGTQFGAAGSSRNQFVTVEGGRDSSTNYAIDGVYVRSLRFNNLSLNPPIDTIQEVSLLRNAFSTEYGQGQAVVSIVTKSGTNRFTGSVYEFLRNDSLNAKNFFDSSKPDYRRNQFGATSGGPVLRNRIFLYAGYEGLRNTQGRTFLGSVPNPQFVAGDFSSLATAIRDPLTGQPFLGNVIPANRISNFAATLRPTIPQPNNVGANNHRIVKDFLDDSDAANVRLDEVLNTNHNLFQRFIWYDSSQVNPSLFSYTNLPQKGANLAVGHTWVISNRLINEFRFGYNYADHLNSPISMDGRNWVGDIGLRNLAGGTDPIDYGRPGFNITGFTANGEGGITQGATENIFSVSNATTKVMGRHNLRFGIQAQFRGFDHLTEVPPRGGFTFNGQFSGNPVADFLLGYCSTCTGAFGSSRSTYRSSTIAPFIDDQWTVTPDLTVQLGLRWEYLAPWVEQDALEGSFDPVAGKIAYNQVPTSLPASLVPLIINQDGYFPSGIVKKDFNNWGPRVGVAYSVNDATVVRTGFGVYYDNLNLNELQFTRLVPPFYGQYSLQPTASTPLLADTLFPDLNNIPVFPAPFSIDPENRSAYSVQWNASVQRSFARNYIAEVAYTGSRGYNLHKRYNINQATPGTTPIVTRVPYPAFQSAILYSSDEGWAEFWGLSARLEKRYSDGLFFLGNYQISENRDNGSGEVEANDTAYAWDFDADASLSRYHQRHRSSFSVGYELPFGEGKRWLSGGGASAYFLGGWTVQAVARFASGFPFTITSTNVCQCGSFVPQRVNLAAGREDDKGKLDNSSNTRWFDVTAYQVPALGTQGTAGRNTVTGPGTKQVDFSFTKRFPFGDRTRLEFRGEIFNIFNFVNFGTPDNNISNLTAGIITTADEARSVQLGFRVIW
ncbi:MAG: carboxypeptidase regulatory-like domain-containing protein [Vicinamibacterales bacterium]